jgi:5-methylthioadenosine/S-adenosylhomocysteine deaminase
MACSPCVEMSRLLWIAFHQASNMSNSTPASAPSITAITKLGIIGGSSFLESHFLSTFSPLTLSTPFGLCRLLVNSAANVYYVQRHAANPDVDYSPPHLINTRAILSALKTLGCSTIIAFGSVGSLNRSLPVGTLVIPDDFFDLTLKPVSFYDYSKQGHIGGSAFTESLRKEVISVLTAANLSVNLVDNGCYAQTVGPRFESAAEIKLLALQCDVVGMTCAHEAILAREIGLNYSLICMVDNYANGLNKEAISYEEFHAGVKKNQGIMDKVLGLIMNNFAPNLSATNNSTKDSNANDRMSDSELKKDHNQRTVADTIIHARYIVQVEPDAVLENSAVVILNGQIIDILPSTTVNSKYSAQNVEYHTESALLPGFINCHTHVGMTLLRGYADDYCLHDWLNHHIWPVEAKFTNPEFVRDSTKLAIAEMLRGGTTTFNDMYFFPEVITDLADKTGVRAVIGLIMLDFPSSYAKNLDEYIEKGQKLRNRYLNHPRIQFSLAPHAPYTVSDDSWAKIHQLQLEAQQNNNSGYKIHTHLHETKSEVEHSEQGINSNSKHRSEHNLRPLMNFDRMKLMNSQLICVHMTQLNEQDIGVLERTGASVVHCPSSNMKLASGFCPVHNLNERKINVALGTDSSASNNALDMWIEMRTAALIAKGSTYNAEALPASEALKLATINGARTLGLEEVTGSITVGKQADLQLVHLENLELVPMYDLVSHLVYSAGRSNVTDVWVAGKKLVSNKKLLSLEQNQIIATSKIWQEKIMDFRAGQSTGKKRAREPTSIPAVAEAPASAIAQNIK